MDLNVSPEAIRHGLKIGFGIWISIIGLIAATVFIDNKIYALIGAAILIYYRLSALHINTILMLDFIERYEISRKEE